MREHEHEPIRGLPEELPDGEYMVWQGIPRWQALARRAFHVDTAALYFVALLVLHSIYVVMDGRGMTAVLASLTWQIPLSLVCVGLLTLAGWLYARSTVYTLTNRRIVIRSGAVTPMMVNLPLENMESAGVRYCSDGTGDIVLTMRKGTRKLFYTLLWPNVRPWHIRRVQPLMRAVEQPQSLVAALGKVVSELRLSDNTPRVESAGNHVNLHAHAIPHS